jgi:hypothetical protein
VELDLTFFTSVTLGDEITPDKAGEITDTGSVAFLHRIDVDLTKDRDNIPGEIGDIILHSVAWRVPENSMTTDLRDVSILVAPASSTSPDDTDAIPVGSIDLIPAFRTVASTPLTPITAGQAALQKHLTESKFTLYVVGYIEVASPDYLPEGSSTIEIDVHGEIHPR